jgi:hypothetical protein
VHHPFTNLQPSAQKEQKRSNQIRNRQKNQKKIIGVPPTFPNVDNNREQIKGDLDITQCSIYHPVDNIEFENFNTILSSILTQLPPGINIILGHDINTNRVTSANSGQHLNKTIGAYDIENRNKIGTSLINLMAPLNMKITNSFFNPRPSHLDATTMHTLF